VQDCLRSGCAPRQLTLPDSCVRGRTAAFAAGPLRGLGGAALGWGGCENAPGGAGRSGAF